jgi:hypothetical protein
MRLRAARGSRIELIRLTPARLCKFRRQTDFCLVFFMSFASHYLQQNEGNGIRIPPAQGGAREAEQDG